MLAKPQFPTEIWDGDTDNPWRANRSDNVDPDFHDWDRVVAEVIATQQRLTTIPPSSMLFVDKHRSADYEPDGTILRPFFDLPSALAATTATELNRQVIGMFPGRYSHTGDVELKAHVDITGWGSPDSTYLEFSSGGFVTPTNMNLQGASLYNLLLICNSVDPADIAIRIRHRGSLYLRDVTISSTAKGVVQEGDSVLVAEAVGISSIYNALDVQDTSFASLSHGIIGCWDAGSKDLIVAPGAYLQVDSSTWFYNNTLQIDGTILRTSYDSRINNTSSVAGASVKDALDVLGRIPDPTSLGDGKYVLQIIGGVATWVAETP